MLLALSALLLACDPKPGADDSGSLDGGAPDGGALDGGTLDGGTDDTGTPTSPVRALQVTVDPDVATVLRVSFELDVDAGRFWVEWTDADGALRATPARDGAFGPQTQVVLGPTAELATAVVVAVEDPDGLVTRSEAVAVTTGALPSAALQPTATVWDPLRTSGAEWILGSVEINSTGYYWGPFWLFVADRQGRIVWYHAVDADSWTLFPRIARGGGHVVFEHAKVLAFGEEQTPLIERRTLSGDQVSQVPADMLGFTFEELPDGSVLFDDYSDWPQVLLTEQAPDGSERAIWDCMAWMGDACQSDFCCSVNAIAWREETDTVLWSMWESDAVVEVDRQTGAVLRHFGALDGAWAFDPPEAGFDKQHWPSWTPEGTLLVSTHTLDGLEHRFREYALDEEAMTLRQVWEYGEGVDLFPIHHGEAVRLEGGNTLLNYGTDGVVRELDPDGQVAWELAWDQPYMLGHNELIEDLYALDAGW